MIQQGTCWRINLKGDRPTYRTIYLPNRYMFRSRLIQLRDLSCQSIYLTNGYGGRNLLNPTIDLNLPRGTIRRRTSVCGWLVVRETMTQINEGNKWIVMHIWIGKLKFLSSIIRVTCFKWRCYRIYFSSKLKQCVLSNIIQPTHLTFLSRFFTFFSNFTIFYFFPFFYHQP